MELPTGHGHLGEPVAYFSQLFPYQHAQQRSPMTTSTSGSPAMRLIAVERSVKPPEHPAMRTARLRSVEGAILIRFEFDGAIYVG